MGVLTVLVFLLAVLIFTMESQGYSRNLQSNDNNRITYGKTAKNGQFPYQVGFYINDDYFYCGAVLISKNFALTAAHCLKGFSPSETALYFGDIKTNNGVRRTPSDLIMHKGYSASTAAYDIGLIKFDEVELTENIKPISLPEIDSSEDYNGVEATVTGWGETENYAHYPELLQFTTMTVITNEECQRLNELFYKRADIGSYNLCTAVSNGQSDCYGDSGGPLVYNDVLIGTVSHGDFPCHEAKFSVYARISSVRDWIKENSGV